MTLTEDSVDIRSQARPTAAPLLHVDAVVCSDTKYRQGMLRLAHERQLHHLSDHGLQVSVDHRTQWFDGGGPRGASAVREQVRGASVLACGVEPEDIHLAAFAWVPLFEGPSGYEQEWSELDFVTRFEGLRCYRIDDLGRPTELADVLIGHWVIRLLARPGASPLHTPTVAAVEGRRVAGSLPWRLAKHAERMLYLDDAELGPDPAQSLTPEQALHRAVSYQIREMPVGELHQL